MAKYRAFTEIDAIQYCTKLGLFQKNSVLQSKEIGDGNLNLVFRITNEYDGHSVIIKQALPFARIVGDAMPLTLDRARIEAEALRIQDEYCAGAVPVVHRFDLDLAITVMEDLKDYEVMRRGLIKSTTYPKFAGDVAHFLAKTLFYTSDFGMTADKKKKWVGRFMNPELCKITEDLVFTEPYFDAPNNHYDEQVHNTVQELREDSDLLQAVFHLKYKFMTEAQALLHGDLHTGSLMVRQDSTKIFDPEFAYYGPIGFDIGAIVANLLLSYSAHYYQEGQESFLHWVLAAIRELWTKFEDKFKSLYSTSGSDQFLKFPQLINPFMRQVLQDTVGFAGCEMIRRVVGLAHVADFDTLNDKTIKNNAEMLALRIGRKLIKQRSEIRTIDDVVSVAMSS